MAVVYLERDGQQFGPFSIEEAKGYILEGRFGAQDMGWIDVAKGRRNGHHRAIAMAIQTSITLHRKPV